MTENRKGNSVVFSDKALKEVSKTPQDPKATRGKRSSFIDDANSILADIKSTINEDVSAEMNRFEEERRSAAEAILQREQELKAAQRAEVKARRAAEEARRQAAAEEREHMRVRLETQSHAAVVDPGPQQPAPSAENVVYQSEPVEDKKGKMPIVAGLAAVALFGLAYFALAPKEAVQTIAPSVSPQTLPTMKSQSNQGPEPVRKSARTDGSTKSVEAVDKASSSAGATTASDAAKGGQTSSELKDKKKAAPSKSVRARPKAKRRPKTKRASSVRKKQTPKPKPKKKKKYLFDENVD